MDLICGKSASADSLTAKKFLPGKNALLLVGEGRAYAMDIARAVLPGQGHGGAKALKHQARRGFDHKNRMFGVTDPDTSGEMIRYEGKQSSAFVKSPGALIFLRCKINSCCG